MTAYQSGILAFGTSLCLFGNWDLLSDWKRDIVNKYLYSVTRIDLNNTLLCVVASEAKRETWQQSMCKCLKRNSRTFIKIRYNKQRFHIPDTKHEYISALYIHTTELRIA